MIFAVFWLGCAREAEPGDGDSGCDEADETDSGAGTPPSVCEWSVQRAGVTCSAALASFEPATGESFSVPYGGGAEWPFELDFTEPVDADAVLVCFESPADSPRELSVELADDGLSATVTDATPTPASFADDPGWFRLRFYVCGEIHAAEYTYDWSAG